MNKKLYWTDASDHDIEVLDPNTGHRKVLIHLENGSIPRAIVVDPASRYDVLYLTNETTLTYNIPSSVLTLKHCIMEKKIPM